MSDDDPQAYNRRRHARIQAKLAELEANKYQQILDHWWQSQRDLEFDEDDMYEVGGFIEYHSKTPSFHKGKYDRDR